MIMKTEMNVHRTNKSYKLGNSFVSVALQQQYHAVFKFWNHYFSDVKCFV